MTDRIKFITHQGKQILLIDVTQCAANEVEKVMRTVPEQVTTRSRGSVLILSDFTGASFDEESIRTMKEAAVFDKPFVKKSAWVGVENLPDGLSKQMAEFSRRDFPAFSNREEALAWLAQD